jgi:hypothetical protein
MARRGHALGMLFGAAILGAGDLSNDAKGHAWLLANIIASISYQNFVKVLAKDDSLSPLNMAYISNAISVSVLAMCSVSLREIRKRDVRSARVHSF